jgi:hypothetical protein
MQGMSRHIAMWSGPRNISTAMMRSWGSRSDTYVYDEPFYAHYLTHTPYRDQHPGADEIIATYQTDWRKVVEMLIGAIPNGKTLSYQKHMTHHMLEGMSIEWVAQVTNAFLIREPREMLVSLAKVLPDPQIDQTGLPQQLALFEHVCNLTGSIPPVIDAADVLKNPPKTLMLLCESLDVPFDEAMLSWSQGKRETDGIWAKYWYDAVEHSTGFEPYQPKSVSVPDSLRNLLHSCESIYQTLYAHRLN